MLLFLTFALTFLFKFCFSVVEKVRNIMHGLTIYKMQRMLHVSILPSQASVVDVLKDMDEG